MAIMPNTKEVFPTEVTSATVSNRPFSGFAQDKPSPKVWANIGYMKNGRFISLPLGSGIDTMEPGAVKGRKEDWVSLQTDKNEFLADLKAIGAEMAPGEERDLTHVIVKLRRVNDDLVLEQSGPQMTQAERIAFFTGKTPVKTEEEVGSTPTKEELQAQLEALQKALAAS